MIDKSTAQHYTWGQNCDGWHLAASPSFSIIQEHMPPHSAEVRHSHVHSRQFFFVLSGALTIEMEGTRELLQRYQGLEIPQGAAHQAMNESADPVEFLVFSSPPSHGDRVIA